jgi:hypothetical protein
MEQVERYRLGKPAMYIKVPVHKPVNEKQTRAFVGDFVVMSGENFKVYTRENLEKTFEVAPIQQQD